MVTDALQSNGRAVDEDADWMEGALNGKSLVVPERWVNDVLKIKQSKMEGGEGASGALWQ